MSERRPTAAVLEARKAFKPAKATSNDYEKAQSAFDQNRERLKTERLAREAADRDGKQPKKQA
jgi:TfoX/Sxy family transcriptional regulator of competence genes